MIATEPLMPEKKIPSSLADFQRNRHTLVIGVAAAILAVVVSALLMLFHLRHAAEARTSIATQNLTQTLELSIEGLIDKIDVSLLASGDEINRQRSSGKIDLPSIVELLKKQQERLPGVAFVRGANEHGEIIYGPGVVVPPADISEREYFIQLRDDPGAGLVISKPVIGRIIQKWVWLFARRLNKPDGSFGGVVYAGILLDQFETLFSRLQLNADDSIALREADLGLIARFSPSSNIRIPIGDKRVSTPFIDTLKTNPDSGSYVSGATSIDDISRAHSYRRNAKYGFIVNVGVSNKTTMAEWRKQAWIISGLVAIFIVALLIFSRLIWRAWLSQEQNMASLQASRESLHEAQTLARLGHYVYDLNANRWTSSDVLDDIFGIGNDYPRDDQHWLELVVAESRQEMQSYLNSVIEQRFFFDREYRIVRPNDGQERWLHGKGKLHLDDNGKPAILVGTIQDITERKVAADEIQLLAFFDSLTQLPNRRLLADRLRQALAAGARSGHMGALLFLDLDHFKNLNDTRGHDVGDILLQQVAQRLESCVREGDTVARLGGDEFVVMLEDLSEQILDAAAKAETIGENILATLNHPYQLGGYEHRNTSSIGATLFNGHERSIEELLKQADIAMYQAKKAGRNTLRFFDPQMQITINARAALETDLHKALEKGQFNLHYQIQVDSALRPVGAEALIRWTHPERGEVSPAKFIPLAEETGLILPIGQWVLETACAQIKAWQQNAATRNLVLAINVSAKQLHQPDFLAQVQATVHQHAINPLRLKLELTESMLLENTEQTITAMKTLKKIGVQFALDDFGTGYSSLQYLKQLPLDQLKIDQSFVGDLTVNSSDRAIVNTIIAMARSLNLDVIAEGVETEAQWQHLMNNGCTHYQGYLLGKPVPIGQFEAFLNQG